ALLAEETVAAAHVDIRGHAVADLEALSFFAYLVDHAGELVPRDEGHLVRRVLAGIDAPVGPADTRVLDLDEHLVVSDLGDRYLSDRYDARFLEDRRFHRCHILPPSVEQDVVASFVRSLDHERLEEPDRLREPVLPAHRHVLVLVAHHIVVADHRKLRDDLLPGHRSPTRDAEAEASAQALPVALRDHARALDVMGYDLSVLRVDMEDMALQQVDEAFDVYAEVDQVRGVEIESELLAPAHQLDRPERGVDVVDQLVR